MGFGQGLSGLNAAAQNLDVIGNNIANAGVVGFKSSSVTFADVYASSQVGLGVQVASVNQRFTTGTVSSTGNQFDMAIDGSKGLFVVSRPDGTNLYTRNGQFFADKDNKIVNSQGQQLMGYAPGSTTLVGMTIPTGNIAPQPTSTITNLVNLDANAAVVPSVGVTGALGQVSLTQNGATTQYFYKINGGVYSWTDASGNPGGPVPPSGAYTTDVATAATPLTMTGGQVLAADGTTPVLPASLPATGGNTLGDATTVGTLYLNGKAYYYKYDAAGPGTGYTWYTDATGTTAATTAADGLPDDAAAAAPYQSGAAGGTAVNITGSSGTPSAALPTGAGNVAYVAPVVAVSFDPTNPASFSEVTPVVVFDSLGNQHTVQQYYTKREPSGGNSVWEVNYVVDGQLSPSNTAKLEFSDAGRLVAGSPATITFTAGGGTSPALPATIAVRYDNSTQFGGSFSQNFTQDGYSTGEYASMSIGTNGELMANYTNGAKKTVGQLVLADFNNLQGLQSVGGNAWAETASSGQAIIGMPGSNGLAGIKGQAVEESNVDMSQELVNLIIAQRTYQANAETIKTQDQILQTMISMR
ncbi:MAG TPA: flagellar hook-basal body complex protein [Castellaniella sp.]|uniref:flagellar hook protein FlgE n=1 Tax=Castellaniella sp. TaxID=1955812 RepID=UPI002EF4A821